MVEKGIEAVEKTIEAVEKAAEKVKEINKNFDKAVLEKASEGIIAKDAEDRGKLIYCTNEWKGYGKQNYYWNEYRLLGDDVIKYNCHRQKIFDGKENEWYRESHIEQTWNKDDKSMPEWLKNYV